MLLLIPAQIQVTLVVKGPVKAVAPVPIDISVLYVDDDRQTCEIMENLMRLYVREIHVAHDGQEGLALFRRHHPDVVLTDFSMPAMDGGEMIRRIREDSPGTRAIFMSAHDSAWLLERFDDEGLNRYVTKPVNMGKLLEVLNDFSTA